VSQERQTLPTELSHYFNLMSFVGFIAGEAQGLEKPCERLEVLAFIEPVHECLYLVQP
jgi:hypothetical protein